MMLVMNQEFRMRISRLFGITAFLDIGNVFPKLRDFQLDKLRKGCGIGLRLYTSFIMFRLDWGLKLDRRDGESASAFFFGIGQTF